MATKKRPTDKEIDDLVVHQGHFGSARKPDDMPSTDPISPTPMVVAVDEIDVYDHNPRQSANEKFDEIKASIAASGMDQTLTITRRPGAERFMISAGGNTRLVAVKELWTETGDERFREVHVLFRPWSGDTDTLVAHLKENDVRGDLIFIDRARALMRLKAMIEESGNGKSLSLRKFSDELAKHHGYSVSYVVLASVEYAHATLASAIPEALAAGMGRRQVDRIRALHKGFQAAWKVLEIPDPETGESQLIELLSRHDGEAIDEDLLRQEIINELAVSSDRDTQYISMVYGAVLDGRDPGPLPDLELEPEPTGSADDPVDPGLTEDPQETKPVAPTQAHKTSPRGEARADSQPPSPPADDGEAAAAGPARARSSAQRILDSADEMSADTDMDATDIVMIKERALREHARDLADQISRVLLSNYTEDCRIIRYNPRGLGFFVGPLSRELAEAVPRNEQPYIAGIWWSLVVLSEQFAHNANPLRSTLIPGDWQGRPIGDAMSEEYFERWAYRVWSSEDEEAQAEVPHVSIADLGSRALSRMSDGLLDIWLDLLMTVREIHKLTNGNPWS